MSNDERMERASKFAHGRAGASEFARPPEQGLVPYWLPKVGGHLVHNSDDPEYGYDTYTEALAAARRFKASCRDYIGRNQ